MTAEFFFKNMLKGIDNRAGILYNKDEQRRHEKAGTYGGPAHL